MSLFLRPAQQDDAGILLELVQVHSKTFAQDGQEYTLDDVLQSIVDGAVTVIDNGFGLPVGAFQLQDRVPGVRAEIHLLVHPKHYLAVMRQRIVEAFVGKALELYRKLYAEPMESQKGAMRLLLSLGFQRKGTRYRHTKQQGKWQDVHLFELHRKTFRKHRRRKGGA